MNVTLCSAFRNSSSYLERYAAQVRGLAECLYQRGDELNVIWCEGDSADDTAAKLIEVDEADIVYRAYSIEIFECSHGGPDYGSVVNAERFANLSKVWNAIWARIPQDADAVLFVESDLIWQPETMLTLLDDLDYMPAVAPMVMLEREGYTPDSFYDFWAFRKGRFFIRTVPPYFPDWDMQAPLKVDSAGSCLAIRGDLARQLTWPEEDVVVGLCRSIYELGGSVWLDPQATVTHC